MPPEDFYSLDETDGGTTTGLRLLHDIREKYLEIPIIIVSIRRMQVAEDLMREFRVADYLEKPVSSIAVANAIKKAMEIS
jgi:FixJ family two-component response regulator